MAGFRQFFTIFLMEFINIGSVYIRGWVGGAWGWGGWWQKLKQRRNKTQIVEFSVAMMCTCTHKAPIFHYKAYRQMCIDSGSHIRSPQPNWIPPLASFHQSWIYTVGKKHSGKADQSTLASGGSELAL